MDGIRIENVTIMYDDFVAIREVSLDINQGELVTILGPSGCGKTTLLRSIAGFITPVSGKIYIGDEDVTYLPPQKRDTAMIFQNYALWPHMTVGGNIEYGLKLKGMPKELRKKKVKEMLQLVKLEDQIDKMPTQLSGGQQQRIALVRALAVDPKVLLCDEPLSNLDAKIRVELRTEIREIAKRLGITVVYVTHDQSEALAISDRIAVLKDGELQQVDPPLKLFNDPDNQFVGEFIGESSVFNGVISKSNAKQVSIAIDEAGTISAFIQGKVEADKPVNVLVRPQDMSIVVNKKGEETDTIRGFIKSNSFMGDHVRLAVELPDGQRAVVAEREKIEEAASLGVNVEANFKVDPRKVLVFDKTGRRLR